MKCIRSSLCSSFATNPLSDDPLDLMLSAGFELSRRENDLLFDAIAVVVAGLNPEEPLWPNEETKPKQSAKAPRVSSNSPQAPTRKFGYARKKIHEEFCTPELKPSPEPKIDFKSSSRPENSRWRNMDKVGEGVSKDLDYQPSYRIRSRTAAEGKRRHEMGTRARRVASTSKRKRKVQRFVNSYDSVAEEGGGSRRKRQSARRDYRALLEA
mmetsp:Transcript_16244/g.32926  ORF Transcript_16244/g.32926 Transcript_16244/m.32926 type:complete len:211 (-) Transcript_16244:644-1276(-)|eukprot:CAMPEP_0167783618 /NCGR_PEP_ID=MMETSP0111_2-20121227/7170_1 /TAXON_ID=91324 /ORGANISM="Lotharella globosa, Strain CCCM811" /LENGTH=210 /DNA_ID=CAMNT_0007674575 /DNA_START=29 /DNA_END=661 /DNA_ORIENTATION=+